MTSADLPPRTHPLCKSPAVVLRDGATLLIAHCQPIEAVSRMLTLAEIAERSTPGHFVSYGATCSEDLRREAAQEDGRRD